MQCEANLFDPALGIKFQAYSIEMEIWLLQRHPLYLLLWISFLWTTGTFQSHVRCALFLLATAQYRNFPFSATLEVLWVTSQRYKGFSASLYWGTNMVMRYPQRMPTEIQVPSDLTCLWLRRKSQKVRHPNPQGRIQLRTQGTPPNHKSCHSSGLALLHIWHQCYTEGNRSTKVVSMLPEVTDFISTKDFTEDLLFPMLLSYIRPVPLANKVSVPVAKGPSRSHACDRSCLWRLI